MSVRKCESSVSVRQVRECEREFVDLKSDSALFSGEGHNFFKCFLIWWLQMAFIAICYMYIDLFALQHIVDKPGEYINCVKPLF